MQVLSDLSLPTAVIESVRDKGGQVANVKAYGAKGDGSTNDYTAFAAAVTALGATGGTLYVPPGTYVVNSTLAFTTPVGIVGAGVNSTIIRRDSGTTAMVTYTNVAGVRSGGYTLQGNSLATHGILLDRLTHSLFENVRIITTTSYGLYSYSTGAAGFGTSWNSFVNLTMPDLGASCVGIHLTGNAGETANSCHNTFFGLRVQHTTGIGIELDDCDNNSFHFTHILRPSGSAYSLVFKDDARGNYFFHLEAKGGVSVEAPADSVFSNVIFGYDRENSQPAPVIAAGAKLSWTEDGRLAEGWFIDSPVQMKQGMKLRPEKAAYIYDEFLSGVASTGTIGALGWQFAGAGTGGGVTAIAASTAGAGRVGVYRFDTGTSAAYLHVSTRGNSAAFDAASFFDMTYLVRMNVNDANTVIRFGLANSTSANPPNDGMYIEKVAADTQWFGVGRGSSSQTRTAALATCDTSWHRFRIRRVNSTTIGFTIDDTTELTVAANLPTNGQVPFIAIGNNSTSGSKTFDIDFFDILITGLSR